MSMKAGELFRLSNEELLEKAASAQAGSAMVRAVDAEFQRRALVAQADAARSAKETARWTLWSAIAITVSVVVMAVGTFVSSGSLESHTDAPPDLPSND